MPLFFSNYGYPILEQKRSLQCISSPHGTSSQGEYYERDINFLLSLPCSSLCVLLLRRWAWRGTKAADCGTSWTDLIGWSHQTTAAASWGMNKCGVWLCCISCFSSIFFYCYCCLFYFQWECKVSVNMHNVFNNKWDNVSLIYEVYESTFEAIKFAFSSWQFVFWVKKKPFILNWLQYNQ